MSSVKCDQDSFDILSLFDSLTSVIKYSNETLKDHPLKGQNFYKSVQESKNIKEQSIILNQTLYFNFVSF